MVPGYVIWGILLALVFFATYENDQFPSTTAALRQVWAANCQMACRQYTYYNGFDYSDTQQQTPIQSTHPEECVCNSCPCHLIDGVITACRPISSIYTSILNVFHDWWSMMSYYMNQVTGFTSHRCRRDEISDTDTDLDTVRRLLDLETFTNQLLEHEKYIKIEKNKASSANVLKEVNSPASVSLISEEKASASLSSAKAKKSLLKLKSLFTKDKKIGKSNENNQTSVLMKESATNTRIKNNLSNVESDITTNAASEKAMCVKCKTQGIPCVSECEKNVTFLPAAHEITKTISITSISEKRTQEKIEIDRIQASAQCIKCKAQDIPCIDDCPNYKLSTSSYKTGFDEPTVSSKLGLENIDKQTKQMEETSCITECAISNEQNNDRSITTQPPAVCFFKPTISFNEPGRKDEESEMMKKSICTKCELQAISCISECPKSNEISISTPELSPIFADSKLGRKKRDDKTETGEETLHLKYKTQAIPCVRDCMCPNHNEIESCITSPIQSPNLFNKKTELERRDNQNETIENIGCTKNETTPSVNESPYGPEPVLSIEKQIEENTVDGQTEASDNLILVKCERNDCPKNNKSLLGSHQITLNNNDLSIDKKTDDLIDANEQTCTRKCSELNEPTYKINYNKPAGSRIGKIKIIRLSKGPCQNSNSTVQCSQCPVDKSSSKHEITVERTISKYSSKRKCTCDKDNECADKCISNASSSTISSEELAANDKLPNNDGDIDTCPGCDEEGLVCYGECPNQRERKRDSK